MTKEKIEQLIEMYKERYNNKEGLVAISEVIQNLKSLQEQPTYEQGFERGKQVGYKEGWRDRGEEPTEEREVEIKQYEGENLYGKYKYGNCICGNYTLGEFDKYCPRCGAKIKRVD